MIEAIIGGDGFIGSHLARVIPDAIVTTRQNMNCDGRWQLDLLNMGELPRADIVYVCAGINGQKRCEGNPESYHVNVDKTVQLIFHYADKGSFIVWISSRSIEWSNSAYSRQKQATESALAYMPNTAIVRAGRVTPGNVMNLCSTMRDIGRSKKLGLTIWGTDDISYDKPQLKAVA